ncbi:prostaglandin E synthase isoform X1 [Sceloporus undulatus]|uniref:prostaglandin E synthase isoform X1 n=2 Tax=Sceloporus undulatus TaxID=8520 RepID=UPI001C4D5E4C|nr:prostaglandin E synthase isoform X1 [Sceloporus undulatus]
MSGKSLSSAVPEIRTWSNGFKLRKKRFHLNIRKNLLMIISSADFRPLKEASFRLLKETETSLLSPLRKAPRMENETFASFIFFGTLLVLKMYVVAIITGQVRLRKKAFANPEDALRHGGLQYHREDPDVERCLRAHRNDMENIYPFLFLGAVYSFLGPNPTVARIHFLVFFFGRIVHTVAYLLKLKAPTRSVAYVVAQLSCFSMALQILFMLLQHWW